MDKQTTFDLFDESIYVDHEVDDVFDVEINENTEYTLNTEELNINENTLEMNDNLYEEDDLIIEDFIEETIITPTSMNTENDIDYTSDMTEIEKEDEEDKILSIKMDEEIIEDKSINEYGKVNIVVLGIGGCGCNAINRMYDGAKNDAITLITMDTSEQTLENVNSDIKVLIGKDEFKGHGTGGNIELTELAFENSKEKIKQLLLNVDMLFLSGGLGRTTGTIGLIKVAEIAKEMGILTIGFATLPTKMQSNVDFLEKYYDKFLNAVDSSVIIENDRISNFSEGLSIKEVMQKSDKMLVEGIKGIYELITKPGQINLDYADIKTSFTSKGSAIMGIGYGKGEDAIIKAIEDSLNSEFNDISNISGAQTIILNITCAKRAITIGEAEKGTDYLYSMVSSEQMKHVFFGYIYDESLGDSVKVTFIATGTKEKNINSSSKITNSKVQYNSSIKEEKENIFDELGIEENEGSRPSFLKR